MSRHGGVHQWDLTKDEVHGVLFVSYCHTLTFFQNLTSHSGLTSPPSSMVSKSCSPNLRSYVFIDESSYLTDGVSSISSYEFSRPSSSHSTSPSRASRYGNAIREHGYGIKRYPGLVSMSRGYSTPAASSISSRMCSSYWYLSSRYGILRWRRSENYKLFLYSLLA
jgi:hypothetical protein